MSCITIKHSIHSKWSQGNLTRKNSTSSSNYFVLTQIQGWRCLAELYSESKHTANAKATTKWILRCEYLIMHCHSIVLPYKTELCYFKISVRFRDFFGADPHNYNIVKYKSLFLWIIVVFAMVFQKQFKGILRSRKGALNCIFQSGHNS